MPGSLRLEPVHPFSLETPYSTPFRRDRRSLRLGKTMAIAYIHTYNMHATHHESLVSNAPNSRSPRSDSRLTK